MFRNFSTFWALSNEDIRNCRWAESVFKWSFCFVTVQEPMTWPFLRVVERDVDLTERGYLLVNSWAPTCFWTLSGFIPGSLMARVNSDKWRAWSNCPLQIKYTLEDVSNTRCAKNRLPQNKSQQISAQTPEDDFTMNTSPLFSICVQRWAMQTRQTVSLSLTRQRLARMIRFMRGDQRVCTCYTRSNRINIIRYWGPHYCGGLGGQ